MEKLNTILDLTQKSFEHSNDFWWHIENNIASFTNRLSFIDGDKHRDIEFERPSFDNRNTLRFPLGTFTIGNGKKNAGRFLVVVQKFAYSRWLIFNLDTNQGHYFSSITELYGAFPSRDFLELAKHAKLITMR